MRQIQFAGVILLIAAILAACGGATPAATTSVEPTESEVALSGSIVVDGSSTVAPISEAVAEEFLAVAPDVRVAVGTSGTGGGFKKFCNGETDISDASRPIKTEEAEACAAKGIDFIELPVAFDGLAVMVNPANDWVDCLTVGQLKTIWEPASQNRIYNWHQVDSSFPDAPLSLYGPGTDSGTFDYFTGAINGEEGASRGDYTASEDDNVLVAGIAGDANALGYFGLAYYTENQDKLKLVGVDSGSGCVLPTAETVNDGSYAPLSRPLFIYIRADRASAPEVKAFVEFYLENVPTLSAEVGYVALPDKVYELAAARFADGVTGSIFEGGSQVGLTLEDLLAAEQK